jgi:hypothetical protein
MLIVVAWLTARVLLFRRRLIDEGMWRAETSTRWSPPAPPAREAQTPPGADAEGREEVEGAELDWRHARGRLQAPGTETT